MRELKLEEIKAILLNLLDEIDSICSENDLKYYLSGGTLLGAVRHKGFIPWDDDIDIHMPRPDYEKLIEIYRNKKGGNKLLCKEIFSDSYSYNFAKLVDTKTYLCEDNAILCEQMGVYLDIFPLDGLGKSKEEGEKIMKRCNKYIILALSCSVRKNRPNVSFVKNMAINFCYMVARLLGGHTRIYNKLMKIVKQNNYYESKFVGEFIDETGSNRINNIEEYEPSVVLDFEDRKCKVPKDYDLILKKFYGDYMQLPPEEKRVSHHDYKAYAREEEVK